MTKPRLTAALVLSALATWQAAACSPGTDTSGLNGGLGSSGAGNNGAGAGMGAAAAAGAAGAGSTSGAGSTGFGGGVIDLGTGASNNPNKQDASCGAVTAAPEQIIVYKDATVTDTTYTYSPVALFIMQDRTGTMVTGFPSGSPNSWPNSIAALQAFTSDPASAGLDVGLGYFPPTSNAPDAQCMGCATPVVPIQGIKTAGPAIISSMNANTPNPLNFTPLQCGLQGMIDACATYMKTSAGEKCVAVFVTDGNTTDPAPAGCDTNTTNLLKIVSDGRAAGVETFAIGMVPGALTFLNQVAQAGGTNAAIDVSAGTSAFINALNTIRGKVANQTSHQVVTQQVISTPLQCQWKIPLPPDGQTFDPNRVNLQFTPAGGTASQFLFAPDLASCGTTPNTWYFDDPTKPTQVLLCPATCDAVKASAGARIDLQFGCERKNVVPA